MYLPVTVAWQRSLATRSTCLSGLLPISRTMPRVLLPARSSLTHSHAPSVSTVKEGRASRPHAHWSPRRNRRRWQSRRRKFFDCSAYSDTINVAARLVAKRYAQLRTAFACDRHNQCAVRSHVHPRAVDHGCTELHEVPAVVRLLSIIRLNYIGASLHLAHQKRSGIAELLVLGFGLARPGVGLGSPAVAPRLHTAQLL